MRAVKVLVVVMSVLLVAGLVFLVYGLATGLRLGPRGFEPIALDLPADCRLADVSVTGDRLLLRLEGPRGEGCQKALLVGLRDGRVIGEVSLSATP